MDGLTDNVCDICSQSACYIFDWPPGASTSYYSWIDIHNYNIYTFPNKIPSIKVQLITTNIENPSSVPLYSLALLPVGITSLFGLFKRDRQQCYFIIIDYLHCVFEAWKELLKGHCPHF